MPEHIPDRDTFDLHRWSSEIVFWQLSVSVSICTYTCMSDATVRNSLLFLVLHRRLINTMVMVNYLRTCLWQYRNRRCDLPAFQPYCNPFIRMSFATSLSWHSLVYRCACDSIETSRGKNRRSPQSTTGRRLGEESLRLRFFGSFLAQDVNFGVSDELRSQKKEITISEWLTRSILPSGRLLTREKW